MSTRTAPAPARRPGGGASRSRRRIVVLALVVLIALAVVGWLAARQIRSPAQIAADAAPPPPSAITVKVERRRLATNVIVRGTVRFGGRRTVELGTSQIKQGSDIVTVAPRRGARLDAGSVAMEVDGRPVIVMPGAIAMHRDLRPGTRGPDVGQLEVFLAGANFNPGPVDGVYDTAAQAAVAAYYASKGYEAFGPTDTQLEQLRTARADAALARDAHLQAVNAVAQAKQPLTPGDVEQARIDAATSLDALHTAQLAVPTAANRLETAQAQAATTASLGAATAAATAQREQVVADADVLAKQNAVALAKEEERLAIADRDALPLDAPAADRDRAAAAVQAAREAIVRAESEVNAAIAVAETLRATGSIAVEQAKADAANFAREARLAEAELRRARLGVRVARRQVQLTRLRVQALERPVDTRTLEAIVDAAADEARRTRAVVQDLTAAAGVHVPADEILFLPDLPVRVDEVKAPRGSTVSGPVMTVTASSLIIDSSLGVSDAKLVKPGDRVLIEEPDLGLRTRGVVAEVDSSPGTRKVDPNRFYMSVIPSSRARAVVGASVKLTIAVTSTGRRVLAVPISAVSVGGDGSSRVQVRRGGRTVLVRVVPGLSAQGYVQVRPARGERLRRGDLVIVGARDGGAALGAGP